MVLSLGSNEGERERNILEAVYRLTGEEGIAYRSLSSIYESEPAGAGFSGTFLNAVCIVETDLSPRNLLDRCKRLESEFGRETGKRDRPIDIDIVLYGDEIVTGDDLEIPHPRTLERLFVIEPMAEIDPGIPVPPDGTRVGDILGGLRGTGWARKVSTRRTIY